MAVLMASLEIIMAEYYCGLFALCFGFLLFCEQRDVETNSLTLSFSFWLLVGIWSFYFHPRDSCTTAALRRTNLILKTV